VLFCGSLYCGDSSWSICALCSLPLKSTYTDFHSEKISSTCVPASRCPLPVALVPPKGKCTSAPIVDAFVRARPGEVPTIRIAAHDTWPVAAGVALYLVKRGTPIAVDDEWLNVVGRSLRERPGPHARLVFADNPIADALRRRGLIDVASSDEVRVLFESTRSDRQ